MAQVLLVGLIPEAVDFTDPALPQGMTAERIRAGIDIAVSEMRTRGWTVDQCMFAPDDTAGPAVAQALSRGRYDCVVIGAGVRLPPRNLQVLEAVINAVRTNAPGAAIAFNTRPEDSADAAARWLPAASREPSATA